MKKGNLVAVLEEQLGMQEAHCMQHEFWPVLGIQSWEKKDKKTKLMSHESALKILM